VALFLLLAQSTLMGNIGAAFADYAVMMFVTLGVAVYLDARSRGGPSGTAAAALGALTVAAFRSKEVGLILTWLPLLFLWHQGRPEVGRFIRRVLWWLGGALAAWVLLMALDGLVLDDFWFSLRPATFAALHDLNLASESQSQRTAFGWLEVLWRGHPGVTELGHSLRYLAFLVFLAALAAAAAGRAVELRVLHLMPVVYLLLMIVLHFRGSYIYTTRYLYPILPVACVLGAAAFLHCGIEKPSGWTVVRPGTLLPFLDSILAPSALLVLLAVLALYFHRPGLRLIIALVLLAFLFAPGFEATRLSMKRRAQVQQSDLILYPWRAFEQQLRRQPVTRVGVSSALFRDFGMAGKRPIRDRIARLFLQQSDLMLEETDALHPALEAAIGTRNDYGRWRRQAPSVAASAHFDRTGQLVLVLPEADVGARH
jgi:hypothetical protein